MYLTKKLEMQKNVQAILNEEIRGTEVALYKTIKLLGENSVEAIRLKNKLMGLQVEFAKITAEINKASNSFDKFKQIDGKLFQSVFYKGQDVLVELGGGKKKQNSSNSVSVPSHANGLARVPYDGYVARLHKNERVLTAEENREYSNGRGNVTLTIGSISLYGVGGNLEAAADKLMRIMARKIDEAGGLMA